jgi:sulfur-carrier protein adenylyltransferase/sulfurtransferase
MAGGVPVTRYGRQTIMPEVGIAGQTRLGEARVLVVGAGGLGVPVLQYLAASGVGTIIIVDGDRVECSNLHRQPMYSMADIGQYKAQAAADRLLALNPDITIIPVCSMLDPANGSALMEGCDVVLDCADTFAVSLTLSDLCLSQGTPFISASVLGLQGYVGGYCASAPSLRALFPDLPDRAGTCATAGVLGPVVAMTGATQAQMALSVLLGLTPSPLGQLVTIDAARWRFGGFRFDGAGEPEQPLGFIALSQIEPDDVVIDVRTEEPVPVTAQALKMSAADAAGFEPPTQANRVIFACKTGLRAHHAGVQLQARWTGKVALMAVPDQAGETPEALKTGI